jgi:hypothetical protein
MIYPQDAAYSTEEVANATPEESTQVTLHDGTIVNRDEVEIVTLHDGKLALVDDDIVQLHDGEYALNNEHVVLLYDERYALFDDAVCMHDDEYALSDEARFCEGNREYYLYGDGQRWQGYWYSHEYLHEHTFECESCGARHDNDDYAEDGYCQNCWDDRDSDDDEEEEYHDPYAVKSYGNRSADYKQSEGKGPLFYGIELEVECKGNVHYSNEARRVYTSLGLDYVVLKRDGSLSDAGFEIVTRPDSLDVHKRKWSEFINSASTTLTSWTNGRCGMHIHASRSALTQLQLGKMLVWINHPNNESVVKTTAGRALKQWACIEMGKKLTDGKKLSPNRYVALNVRDETVEIRIFRGTLKPESFYKNLEFYDALIAFCAPANHGCRDIETPQPFLKFVTYNVKSYPHLHEFYVRRGVYSRAGIEHEPTQVANATQ